MYIKDTSKQLRIRRLPRIRKWISGDVKRPRMTVFKSNTSISVQLIDDKQKKVLMSFQVKGKNIAAGKKAGTEIALLAKAKKINTVVFDRSGYKYHGAVKAVADAVREGGLKL
jgi:large subunit ribosomal protein L18